MKQSEVIAWYSRLDVASELVRVGQDREVAHMFRQGGYGRRPSIIQFPADVKAVARQGATSFHMSQERWSNPMSLNAEVTEREIIDLRRTWDLVVDIDCPIFEYSTLAAEEIIKTLTFHGVKNPSVKFSGNRGWHIGIVAEAFPNKVGNKEFRELFPDAAVTIISYIKEFIRETLSDRILEYEGDIKKILEKTGKKKEELFTDNKLDVFSFLELDIALGSVRHLVRAPYSLHEKTWLVSLPIKPKDIRNFKKDDARPENVEKAENIFFNSENVEKDEALQLLVQALDWSEKTKKRDSDGKGPKEYTEIEDKIPERYFPPCINYLLKGLPDGRKRALFALINFLRMMNWPWEEIEEKIEEWNKGNSPRLKEGYIRTQVVWGKKQRKKYPPPNCGRFYYNIGVPVGTCKDHKNPVSYAVRKLMFSKRQGSK